MKNLIKYITLTLIFLCSVFIIPFTIILALSSPLWCWVFGIIWVRKYLGTGEQCICCHGDKVVENNEVCPYCEGSGVMSLVR